jgi:hypothetical protein
MIIALGSYDNFRGNRLSSFFHRHETNFSSPNEEEGLLSSSENDPSGDWLSPDDAPPFPKYDMDGRRNSEYMFMSEDAEGKSDHHI